MLIDVMVVVRTGRAPSLAPDERRAMIIDAAIPLLLEQGREVTTKQIADRAGVAEGTLFRAFGDKESIIDAAVQKFLDPEPTRSMLRGIDPDQPLRDKVHDVLFHLRARMTGIMGIMGAIGPRPMPERPAETDFVELLTAVLGPDLDRMRAEPGAIAHFIRMVAFASSIGPFNEGFELTPDQLADLIVGGITKPKE
jgi:AcrR family transcriptional regulator